MKIEILNSATLLFSGMALVAGQLVAGTPRAAHPAPAGANTQEAAYSKMLSLPLIDKTPSELEALATRKVNPALPRALRKPGIDPAVVVRLIVSETGAPIDVVPVSGDAALFNLAAAAAGRWAWIPPAAGGKPVRLRGEITIRFVVDLRPPDTAQYRAFQQMIRDQPDESLGYMLLAQYYTDLGFYEDARETYEQLIKLNSRDADVYYFAGSFQALLGDYQAAIENYQNALKLKPDSAAAHSALASAYSRKQDYEAALPEYRAAIDLNSEPAERAELQRGLGWTLIQLNKLEEAADAYRKAIELKPDRQSLYLDLAQIYFPLHRENEWIALSRQALERRPEFRDLRYLLLTVLEGKGRQAEGLEVAQEGLKFDPSDRSLYQWLGIAYHNLRRYPEVVSTFEKLLQMNLPRDEGFNAYLMVADSYQRLQQLPQALEKAQYLAAHYPEQPKAHLLLGQILQRMEKSPEAYAAYMKAVQTAPRDPMILNAAADYLLENTERRQEAFQMIRRVLDLDPNNAAALHSLGVFYFQAGKMKDAEHSLRESEIRDPSSSSLQEHLGDVYKVQGKPSQARQAWQRALALTQEEERRLRLERKLGQLR